MCSGGKKKENAQILKPTADKLVGRCAAVSINRLPESDVSISLVDSFHQETQLPWRQPHDSGWKQWAGL